MTTKKEMETKKIWAELSLLSTSYYLNAAAMEYAATFIYASSQPITQLDAIKAASEAFYFIHETYLDTVSQYNVVNGSSYYPVSFEESMAICSERIKNRNFFGDLPWIKQILKDKL